LRQVIFTVYLFCAEKKAMFETAIIGGTGFNTFAGAQLIGDAQLPMNCATPYGTTSTPLQIFGLAEQRFGFIARHGQPHRIPPHLINYRANLWTLRESGVRDVIAVNAVGGIDAQMQTGVIAVPHQIIDYTYGREHTYYDGGALVLDHVDFSQPYCSLLRERLLRAAKAADVAVIDGGVYGAMQGPRLESAAEIDRLERDGCTMVGMTGMPEAALARELKLNYVALCLVVNPAAGRSNETITLEKMQAAMAIGMLDIQKILRAALSV
jgi:5'-methylthioinosine phosphorylase